MPVVERNTGIQCDAGFGQPMDSAAIGGRV